MAEKRRRRRETPIWVMPAMVIVAVGLLVVGGALFLLDDPGPRDTAGSESPVGEITEQEGPDYSEFELRDPGDLLTAGPVDAPVGLIVFSDYQCPYCAQWNHETLPAMMEYADAGDLRIEWRDVNIFGPESERAARAAYAAALQDSYWEYHDALFAGGETRPESELTDDTFVALAGELGLDEERFAADLDSEETTAMVAEHERLGRGLGVPSTPVFLLGGQPFSGAQPTEVFTDAVDSALERAG